MVQSSRLAGNVAPHVPERVGRYEILLPIASGGMATVYLARSRGVGGFERDVALKLTHAHLRESTDFTNDLLDEAKLAGRIKHPNVVPVLDVDDDPQGIFLVMEYIEGDSLGGLRRRARDPMPRAVALRVLVDALAGLHAAHELRDEQGQLLEIVHRDFSPQNILVGIDGVTRLTDFGIAKAATRLGDTRTGLVKGKVGYMAPEQARNMSLDRRCDVWAAGVIAWELLAGGRLFNGDDVGVLLRIVSEEPPLLRTRVADISPEIEAVVHQALTIDTARRLPTAQAFARALAQAARASGELCEREQVADYVLSQVGERLAQRRARVDEVVRLRSQVARVVGGGPAQDDMGSQSHAVRSAQPGDSMLSPESAPPVPAVDVTLTVKDIARPLISPRQLAVGGAALASVLLALVLWTAWSRRETAAAPPGEAASTVPATLAATASAVAPPPPVLLKLEANAPLTVLVVEGRELRPEAPVTSWEVPISAGDHERTLHVSAVSSDGRTASALVPAGAGAAEITFAAFPAVPHAAPERSAHTPGPSRATAATPVRHRAPNSAAGAKVAPPLAASPYAK